MQIQDSVFIVTGGASGLGEATVRAFHGAGAKVVIADVGVDKGEALAAALGQPLALDYRPRLPATTALQLVSRQDYAGREDQPAVILRFIWPRQSAWDR